MAQRKPLVEHRCEQCSETFTSPRTRQRFCSYRCNKRWQSAKHWSGGYCPPPKHRVCAGCGVEFTTERNDGRFCSKSCARRLVLDKTSDIRAEQRRRTAERRTQLQLHAAFVPTVRQCPQCNALFVASPGQHFCSAYCRDRTYLAQPRPRQCIQCGEVFVVVGGSKLCSSQCRRRRNREVWNAGKQVRRARKRKAPNVERVYRKRIFERDGYRCQLCGGKLAMTQQVPHPKAPTLDHIVPLSQGGEHIPANVQAAHFLCNSTKHTGTSERGNQLRLVG